MEERGSILIRYKLVVNIVNDLVCSFAASFLELWHKAMIRLLRQGLLLEKAVLVWVKSV